MTTISSLLQLNEDFIIFWQWKYLMNVKYMHINKCHVDYFFLTTILLIYTDLGHWDFTEAIFCLNLWHCFIYFPFFLLISEIFTSNFFDVLSRLIFLFWVSFFPLTLNENARRCVPANSNFLLPFFLSSCFVFCCFCPLFTSSLPLPSWRQLSDSP